MPMMASSLRPFSGVAAWPGRSPGFPRSISPKLVRGLKAMKWLVAGLLVLTLVGIYLFSLGYTPEAEDSFHARKKPTEPVQRDQPDADKSEKGPAPKVEVEDLQEGTGTPAKYGDEVTV